ncbi:hypothetical protein B0T22DRAFT_141105 [Podospora appendiculata]|uniref:Ankyrin n=1 Tax=Podospora appendiculata TaxID=314037 RepID=A0AAE0X899_9PEZI|nr:hypothetical protein B0T22DRAFT_141105 [Podospora appendiculata]
MSRGRHFDVDALHEVCVCPVVISPNKNKEGVKAGMRHIKPAYFTVKEFLESDRIRSGPGRDFYLSNGDPETTYLTAAINLFMRGLRSIPRTMHHCFGYFWSSLDDILRAQGRIIILSEHLFKLVCRFLDPENGHIPVCIDEYGDIHVWSPHGMIGHDLSWLARPRSKGPAAALALMCGFHLVELMKKYAARFTPLQLEEILETTIPFGHYEATHLGVAVMRNYDEAAKMLLSWSSKTALVSSTAVAFLTDIQDSDADLDLMFYGRYDKLDPPTAFPLLIGAGACLNPENARITPLQLAIIHSKGSLELVELMLQAGADANAVGEPLMRVIVRLTYDTMKDWLVVEIHDDIRPLDICRRVADPNDSAMLEQLLISYGARVE